MKIMSFNIQHGWDYLYGGVKLEIMADAINKCEPDIVGLNEVYDKGTHELFQPQAEILSDLTGLKYHYFAKAIDCGENNPYGNAFISRYPIVSAETILVPDPNPRAYNDYYETRSLLKVKLENGVTVLVTHFGLNPDEHENSVKTILENMCEEKCVLMGDFNSTPDNAILKPVFEKMTDTAQYFSEPFATFPSHEPERKIDYILVSKDIKVLSANVPNIIASDHRPHIAVVEV